MYARGGRRCRSHAGNEVISLQQVSRGTVYKHFPSPAALLQDLPTKIAEKLNRILVPMLGNRDDLAEWITHAVRVISRITNCPQDFAQCLVLLRWPEGRGTDMLQIVSRNIEEEFRRGRSRRMPMSRAISIVGGAEL